MMKSTKRPEATTSVTSVPVKRPRRTDAELDALTDALIAIVKSDSPMTVRQVFYQAVVTHLMEKTPENCEDVSARLTDARERFIQDDTSRPNLDPSLIVDTTRRIERFPSWNDLPAFLNNAKHWYDRNPWRTQTDGLPIIIIEKEALVGVIRPVTNKYFVPLIATRGSSSFTLMNDLAKFIENDTHDITLYHFGDFDAAGENFPEQIKTALGKHGCFPTIERRALTHQQVVQWKLPTNPDPPKLNDHRGQMFQAKYGAPVQLDALTPTRLRQLVEDAITPHIDQIAWSKNEARQKNEQRKLERLIGSFK